VKGHWYLTVSTVRCDNPYMKHFAPIKNIWNTSVRCTVFIHVVWKRARAKHIFVFPHLCLTICSTSYSTEKIISYLSILFTATDRGKGKMGNWPRKDKIRSVSRNRRTEIRLWEKRWVNLSVLLFEVSTATKINV
jgi:hypothetical protein